uniref:Uncharacterized protein n=1 Tax=Spongospora subterranea TaxID=70186 RepID=A0A0H5RCQ7_9EUKA|eukprot:CRZ11541.1 hypothetical protein [Spongospora subterranea]
MGLEILAVSSQLFPEAMQIFLDKHEGSADIKSCFKDGEVKSALEILIKFLVAPNNISNSVKARALSCIKLLTRARTELEILLEETNLSIILDLALELPEDNIDFSANSVINQAVRVVINLCIIHQSGTLPVLHRQRCHVVLLSLLSRIPLGEATDETLFSLARLLFYMSLDTDVQAQLRGELDALPIFAAILVNRNRACSPGQVASLRLNSNSATLCMALSEVIHVMFAVGSSPNSGSPQMWQMLTGTLLELLMSDNVDILELKASAVLELIKSPYYSLMLDIVNLLFCFNKDSLVPLMEKQVMRRIFSLLEIQARYNCQSVESALVPILTVTETICSLNPEVAKAAKVFVFGEEFANNKSLKYEFESGDTTLSVAANGEVPPPLCKILTRMITTFEPNLKRAVSQFLYTLCEKRSDEYIRVVGLGNAMGLLSELQLPGYQVPLQ